MSRPTSLLLPDPAALDGVPVEELPAIMVQLLALQAAAAVRLQRPPNGATPQLLTAQEAAEVLRVPLPWLEKRSRSLPFRVGLADGTVRYDAGGLRKWLAGRTGAVRS